MISKKSHLTVGIKKAKNQLSRLLHRATLGEEIIITRKGMPVARLIGINTKPEARKLGTDRGKLWMAEDFDAPLPAEILTEFIRKKASTRKHT